MNEQEQNANFNFGEEKKKLIKKISIFLVISAAFTFLFVLGTESSFFTCLMVGFLCGCAFYIPGRLQSYFHMRWFITLIVGVVFLLAVVFLAEKIGPIAYIILLYPPVDIGYSIYKMVTYKKRNGGEQQQ